MLINADKASIYAALLIVRLTVMLPLSS